MRSAVPSSYYPSRIPGSLAEPSRDFPADAVDSWEETFFFPAGAAMMTPELPRRGADLVLAEFYAAAGGYLEPLVLVPALVPGAGVLQYTQTAGVAGARRHQMRLGACPVSWSSLPWVGEDASGQTYELPVPPVFRVAGYRQVGITWTVGAPAPTGGAWLVVRGMRDRLNDFY